MPHLFQLPRRAFRPLLLLTLVSISLSCVRVETHARFEARLAHGENLLAASGHAQALEAFSQAAREARNPATRARALIGQARCHIALAQYERARNLLYEARKLHSQGALSFSITRALGEVHFQQGEYSIARRHLREVLQNTLGSERDLVLARLVICAQSLRDFAGAKSYQAAIENPHAPEIVKLRVLHAPAEKVATSRPASYTRKSTPPSAPKARARRVEPPSSSRGIPRVEPRRNWNASPTRRNVKSMGTPTRITVHHTGGQDLEWSNSYWDAASQIKRIQTYHQREKGWADIGYHFIIDRAGRVWEGRPLRYQGAHAGDSQANQGNIGVVLLGNFTRQHPSDSQVQALFQFLNGLTTRYRMPPHRVHTHSEIRDTTCPGPLITRLLRDYRNRGVAVHSHRH